VKITKKKSTRNNAESNRRVFMKQSAILGGGALLWHDDVQNLQAEQKPTTLITEKTPPANDTLKTIQGLRTIHGNFTGQGIPEASLQLILQASVRAANASNMQSYSIVVVKDRKLMKEVCTYQGGCMLLYCVDYNRLKASAESLGHPYVPDNIVNFVTASINAALAAQTAAIAARSLGLDYLITNGIHRGDMARVWKLLELPQAHCFPLLAMVLGYPTKEPDYQMGRLEGAGVIHREKYHPLTKPEVEEITRQYDANSRHLALNDQWKVRGHKHYLDWFFKEWLGRGSNPTDRETQMFQLLKRCGFVDLQMG
jgi:nitroreductase